MKAQAHALASARVKMQQAMAAAALSEGDLATLEERLVDAQTKHASALADLRAGRLDEAVAGARMAAANADAADLEAMIAAARPKVTEAARVRASECRSSCSGCRAGRRTRRAGSNPCRARPTHRARRGKVVRGDRCALSARRRA